jgi:hypothetical protein
MDTDAPGFFQADPALSLFYDFDFFFHGSPSYPIPGRGSKGNEVQRNLRDFRWVPYPVPDWIASGQPPFEKLVRHPGLCAVGQPEF